jgi:hypothetical protein
MSRNKNGLIKKATCVECKQPTRQYRIAVRRAIEWSQKSREWLPVRKETPVCSSCLHLVQNLDTVLFTKSPELEVA